MLFIVLKIKVDAVSILMCWQDIFTAREARLTTRFAEYCGRFTTVARRLLLSDDGYPYKIQRWNQTYNNLELMAYFSGHVTYWSDRATAIP